MLACNNLSLDDTAAVELDPTRCNILESREVIVTHESNLPSMHCAAVDVKALEQPFFVLFPQFCDFLSLFFDQNIIFSPVVC